MQKMMQILVILTAVLLWPTMQSHDWSKFTINFSKALNFCAIMAENFHLDSGPAKVRLMKKHCSYNYFAWCAQEILQCSAIQDSNHVVFFHGLIFREKSAGLFMALVQLWKLVDTTVVIRLENRNNSRNVRESPRLVFMYYEWNY